ncbi:MAG: nicotinate-nucleotide adenylyltransferase [Clostridia bacterium]|nr:nicotinate-nucleotide adenylyltransferase [Clostridia bacterium]
MKKMGLFGGTFDPIHKGHISMALRMAETLGLDGVVLMPTFVPPHKIKENMASAAHRLAMCRLAVEAYPCLSVSDMELQRKGASFTVDTLTALCEKHPDTEWYLLVGADMFTTLRTWHRFGDIASMAVLCTIAREGTDMVSLREYAAGLAADGIRCVVDEMPVEPYSSTQVRERIAAGEKIADLVGEAVEQYIANNGLYRETDGMHRRTADEQYIEIIRSRLGDYRFHHSLCVAQEARRLALLHGADPDKAYTAGILHDIMKDTDPQAQLRILDDYGVTMDAVEAQTPMLWHARSGEVFLRNILGITDEEILSAVRYHTTGRAGMSRLEQVVFTADFTSADRNYPDVAVIRALAARSLTAAIRYGVEYTVRDLIERGCPVHPDTLAVYNEIVLSEGNGGQTNE